jgi:hypothetical protein
MYEAVEMEKARVLHGTDELFVPRHMLDSLAQCFDPRAVKRQCRCQQREGCPTSRSFREVGPVRRSRLRANRPRLYER